jgi:hypothetical protein
MYYNLIIIFYKIIFCIIYINEDKEGFRNFLNNLRVVQNEEIKENKELKIIFEKTISE